LLFWGTCKIAEFLSLGKSGFRDDIKEYRPVKFDKGGIIGAKNINPNHYIKGKGGRTCRLY
jgi:hypothetical protein